MISMQGFLTADRVVIDPANHELDTWRAIDALRQIDYDQVVLFNIRQGDIKRRWRWGSITITALLSLFPVSWKPIYEQSGASAYWHRVDFIDATGAVIAWAWVEQKTYRR